MPQDCFPSRAQHGCLPSHIDCAQYLEVRTRPSRRQIIPGLLPTEAALLRWTKGRLPSATRASVLQEQRCTFFIESRSRVYQFWGLWRWPALLSLWGITALCARQYWLLRNVGKQRCRVSSEWYCDAFRLIAHNAVWMQGEGHRNENSPTPLQSLTFPAKHQIAAPPQLAPSRHFCKTFRR